MSPEDSHSLSQVFSVHPLLQGKTVEQKAALIKEVATLALRIAPVCRLGRDFLVDKEIYRDDLFASSSFASFQQSEEGLVRAEGLSHLASIFIACPNPSYPTDAKILWEIARSNEFAEFKEEMVAFSLMPKSSVGAEPAREVITDKVSGVRQIAHCMVLTVYSGALPENLARRSKIVCCGVNYSGNDEAQPLGPQSVLDHPERPTGSVAENFFLMLDAFRNSAAFKLN